MQLWGGGGGSLSVVLPMKGFALCEVHLLLKAWHGCGDPLGGKFLLPLPRLLEGHASQAALGATHWGLFAVLLPLHSSA